MGQWINRPWSMDKTTMDNGTMDKTTMVNGAMDKTTMVNGTMDKTTMVNGAMDKTTMVNGTMDKTTMVNGTMDRDAMHCVSANNDPDPDPDPDPESIFNLNFHDPPPPNKFGPQSKNLASIIRGIKSSVTTKAKISGNINFGWQSRFHDHIIRNSTEFYRIRNYIINNPANWGK